MQRLIAGMVAGTLAIFGSGVALAQSPSPSAGPGLDVSVLEQLCLENAGDGPAYQVCLDVVHLFLVPGSGEDLGSLDALIAEPTPEPTQPPTGTTYGVGEKVTLLENDVPNLEVTVAKARRDASIGGDCYGADRPDRGNAYYSFFVTYKAIGDGANYGSFDWDAFADDEAIDTTFLCNKLGKSLGSGQLPNGRKASGWLYFEGPAGARTITLSYLGNAFLNDGPVFDVVWDVRR